ncbi:MAG: Ni/Fe hydrogenase subunit alpha [Deltaproteobacteria bacterium]|nr:Ni/Fe hydrogenase subunit alpha [Deltaproteobacteria bacterium]
MQNAQSKTFNIDVHHVTRVEGHGRIRVNVRDNVVEDVKLCITEANRFFENFVKGMRPEDVPWIVSRICGICCVGHQLAATKTVEDAMGIVPSAQTILLRKLLTESQFLQSHVLHVYFLAVPDFVGVPSVLPLVKTHPDVVLRALRLKKLANDYTAVMGGRVLHPMANTLKGWRKLPSKKAMEEIRDRLIAAVPDLLETIAIVKTLKIPPYERETEYVSLKHPDEYALYDGDVYSSDTKSSVPVNQYRAVTNEFTVAHSTTKWSKWHRDSYFAGALARVNNNFDQLRPEAKNVAAELGFKAPCYNPYMNNVAQVIEIIHCAYNSIAMLEQALNMGLVEEDLTFTAKAGEGFGSCEVPRGILFHNYTFDANGRCSGGNAIIPTSQNVNNIEQDMKAFVPKMLPVMSKEELTLHMEMLLRAYDPCISCSVHMLDVEFTE